MAKFSLAGIKNIIFDLGKVIVDLDPEATTKAFKTLCGDRYEEIMNGLTESSFFEKFERGEVSSKDFIETIQKRIGNETTLISIIEAWNAMLGQIPERRFEILLWAKDHYRTFCLSNTNEIHINSVYGDLMKNKGIVNLNNYFEKVYLSHEMGQRKPEERIFQTLLQSEKLNPKETLFIDDTEGHLLPAEAAGIYTFHLSNELTLEKLFKNISTN